MVCDDTHLTYKKSPITFNFEVQTFKKNYGLYITTQEYEKIRYHII